MSDADLRILTSSSIEQKLVSHAKGASNNNIASIAGIVQDGLVALLDVSTLPRDKEIGSNGISPALAAGEAVMILLSFTRRVGYKLAELGLHMCLKNPD